MRKSLVKRILRITDEEDWKPGRLTDRRRYS